VYIAIIVTYFLLRHAGHVDSFLFIVKLANLFSACFATGCTILVK